jgi:PAS domain S-box-containing protein
MVLDPDLRIIAATEAYLRATLTRRADILGRYVFDVFPDNPGDPSADAVRNSTASFRRVLQSHVTDVMGLQRHDVRKPEAEGGGWEARYWNTINSPVLKPDGSLAYIMHHVDNVTELVLLQEQGVKQASVTEALRAQAAQMKAEIAERQRAEAALRESEERLRVALTATELGTWDYDPVTGALVWDARCKELFGLPPEIDVNYDMFFAGLHPDDRERANQVVQRTFDPASDGLFDVEYRTVGLRDGGMVHWVHATGRVSFNAASQPIRFIGTVQDITGRKRAEEALRLTQASVDGAAEMVAWFTPDSRVHYANDATCRALGYSREELVQMSALDFSPGFTREQYHQHWEEVRKRKSFTLEVTHRRKDGTEYPAEVLVNHVVYGGHEYIFAYGRDITERKRIEEALWRSEKLYRAIGESIDYGIWVCAPDGRNTYASESYLKLMGMTQEQWSNFGWGDVLHPEDAERTIAAWKECIRTEGRWDIEHRFRGVDGKWHPILARGGPVRDERGQITCWAGINLDISALKQTEESLRESESRERARAVELEALMDAAPAAIFIARDPECLSMGGNRACYALLRRQPEKNLSKSAPDGPMNFRTMRDGVEIPPSELPLQKAASSGEPVRNYAFDVVFDDGVTLNVTCDAVPLLDEEGLSRGGVGLLTDVTELKRAEERLRQAQKLESLGLLAGGVAHDFNNLLVGVIGNASLAQEILPPDHPAADLLDGVLKTGEQAAHLTRQMLAYSGKGKFVVEPLDLSALIPEMSGLVRPSIPKKIAFSLDLDSDLPAIEADRGQVQQVFMNLTLNASEAIGNHDGLISVRTCVQEVDERYLRLHSETAALRLGKYVCLEVRDTGCGMDDATKTRVFDPFFSTKFTGRGLGLAAVAGIVRGHKGAITVDSAPGKGSCFTVLFPAVERAVKQSQVAGRDAALHGAGTVLVVDDEEMVREFTKKALERHGYTVLLADSGLAAIDVFRRHPGEIALVVLDLSMQHMSGEEALPELRKIRPEVKVVISSGYSEAETMTLFQGQRVSGFVQKPYTSKGLAEKVKVCLG